VKGLENNCLQKLGFKFGKKREKLCNILQSERTASIAFQNQSDKTLFVIHEKKLFAQAKGIKTHCNAFYVNKNRAVMPVISLSLSYVVSDMS